MMNPGRGLDGNEMNNQQGNIHKIQYISQKRYRKNGSSSSSLRRSDKGQTLGLMSKKNQNNFYSNNPQNARNSSSIKKASLVNYQSKGLNSSVNQIVVGNYDDMDFERKNEALTPQRYKRSFEKQLSPQFSQNKNGSLDDSDTKPKMRLPPHEDETEDQQNQNMQDKSFSSQKPEVNQGSLNTQNSPSVKIIKMNNLLSHNIQKDLGDSPSNSNKLVIKTEVSQTRGNQNEMQSITLNQETPTKQIEDIYKSPGSHQTCWDIYKINENKQLQLKQTNLQDEMKRIDELQVKNEKAISTYIQIRQDLLDLATSQKIKQIQKGVKMQKQ